MARFFVTKTNLEPEVLDARSKSSILRLSPRSICDFGLKSKFLISPDFSISRFEFSSFPSGTSSKGIFGIEDKISSNLNLT